MAGPLVLSPNRVRRRLEELLESSRSTLAENEVEEEDE